MICVLSGCIGGLGSFFCRVFVCVWWVVRGIVFFWYGVGGVLGIGREWL